MKITPSFMTAAAVAVSVAHAAPVPPSHFAALQQQDTQLARQVGASSLIARTLEIKPITDLVENITSPSMRVADDIDTHSMGANLLDGVRKSDDAAWLPKNSNSASSAWNKPATTSMAVVKLLNKAGKATVHVSKAAGKGLLKGVESMGTNDVPPEKLNWFDHWNAFKLFEKKPE